jgi:REP element-mobilizing transposase RayT
MPRPKRICPAGDVFHVLNRAVARLTMFEKPEDYDAFLAVVQETWQEVRLPIFAMVVMPNHWHFVVRPDSEDQVSAFFRRLAVTHTMRWHAHCRTGGTGRHEPQTDAELQVLRNCMRRSCPFGDEGWATSSAVRLNLESTRRPRGRPKKES